MKRYEVYIDAEFSGFNHDEFLFEVDESNFEEKVLEWAEKKAEGICSRKDAESFKSAVGIFRKQLTYREVTKKEIGTDYVELASYKLSNNKLETLLEGIESCKNQIANSDFGKCEIVAHIPEGSSDQSFIPRTLYATIRRTKYDDGSFEYADTIVLIIRGINNSNYKICRS